MIWPYRDSDDVSIKHMMCIWNRPISCSYCHNRIVIDLSPAARFRITLIGGRSVCVGITIPSQIHTPIQYLKEHILLIRCSDNCRHCTNVKDTRNGKKWQKKTLTRLWTCSIVYLYCMLASSRTHSQSQEHSLQTNIIASKRCHRCN